MLPQFCHCRSNTTKRVRKSLTPSATPLIVKKRRCFSRVSRRRQLTYTVSAINFSRSAAFPTWHGIPIATSPLATNSETVASTFACFREDTTTLAPKKLKRHKGYMYIYMYHCQCSKGFEGEGRGARASVCIAAAVFPA